MNPLTLSLLPLLLALYFRPRLLGRPDTAYAIWVGILLFGVLRNIPAFPFTLLVPHV